MKQVRLLTLLLIFCATINGMVSIDSLKLCPVYDTNAVIAYEFGKLPISEPGVYILQGSFRKADIPSHPALYFPPVPYPTEMYLNGVDVYKKGLLDNSKTMADFSARAIQFPAHEIADTNILTIYFYTDGQVVAIPEFSIGTLLEVEERVFIQSLLNHHGTKGIIIISFLLFLFFGGFSAASGFKQKDYLFFSLATLFIGLSYMPFMVNFSNGPEIFIFKVSRLSLLLITYFLFLFMRAFTGSKSGRFIAYLLLFLFITSIPGFALAKIKVDINNHFDMYSNLIIIPSLILCLFYLIKDMVKEITKEKVIILLGFLFFVYCAFSDLTYTKIYKEPFFWLVPYGYLSIILGITTTFILRQRRLFDTLKMQKDEIDNSNEKLLETNKMLHEAMSEVDAVSNAKSAFLQSISHELRTPLNGIVGSLDEIKEYCEADPEAKNSYHILSMSYRRLHTLISNILDYVALEEKTISIENHAFDLHDVIDELTLYIYEKTSEKGLSFLLECQQDGIPDCVIGDKFRILQILTNLLINAVTFTESGSVVLQISFENSVLICSIKDTGIGIDEKHAKLLFEAFKNRDNTFTRAFDGAGFGLSISNGLIQKMGGEITFESSLGEGSTFTIKVPMEVSQAVSGDGEDAMVLVVEDNKTNQVIVSHQLAELHFNATVVSNGEEAVKAVKSGTFDVILMDIQMPVMNGLDATKEIRKFNLTTPIIAWTANCDKETCLRAGMDGFLSKPTNLEALKSELLKQVKRAQP